MPISGEKEQIKTIDHIEETLSLFPEEKIISPESKEKALTNACEDVLTKFGKFVNPDTIQKVFPGVDLDNIDNYDFKDSKLKVFVLDADTYKELDKGLHGNSPDNVRGMHLSGQREQPVQKDSLTIKRKSHLASLIVLKESDKLHMKEAERQPFLEGRMRHEILHALEIGKDMPNSFLEEGLVTYLQYSSGPKNELVPKLLLEEREKSKNRSPFFSAIVAANAFMNEEYPARAAAFYAAREICMQTEDWSIDKYHDALISEDPSKRKELSETLLNNAGPVVKGYIQILMSFYQ